MRHAIARPRPTTESRDRHRSWPTADERSLADDVLDGLTRPFKELPPKHFYDARGAELFDRICELPEYYPTRTERAILERAPSEIVQPTGAGELVELGSGTAEQDARAARRDAQRGHAAPLRPGRRHRERACEAAASELVDEYHGLRVHGVIGDFERHLERVPRGATGHAHRRPPRRHDRQLPARHAAPRCCATSASCSARTTGCCWAPTWSRTRACSRPPTTTPQGVTAEFNRNVLRVINRELDADFAPDAFEHVAFFDREHEWVEMRLRAPRPCSVLVSRRSDLRVRLRRRRGAAHRDQREVHARARDRGRLRGRRPGARRVGIRTATRLFRVSLARRRYRVPASCRSKVAARSSRAAPRALAKPRLDGCTPAARTW